MTNTNTAEVKTHKVVQVTPDLNKLATLFVDTFPQLSVDDQQLTLKLYQLLAEGKPVSRDRLAQALGRSTDTVIHTLNQWPGIFYDESERIVAFLGLSVNKTQHQLTVNGRTVYWCCVLLMNPWLQIHSGWTISRSLPPRPIAIIPPG